MCPRILYFEDYTYLSKKYLSYIFIDMCLRILYFEDYTYLSVCVRVVFNLDN